MTPVVGSAPINCKKSTARSLVANARQSALMQAEVWRGLSNLVQAEEWKPYKKSLPLVAEKELIAQRKPENKTLIYLIVSIAIVMVAIAIVPLLLFSPLKSK